MTDGEDFPSDGFYDRVKAFTELEFMANFEATAKLNVQQYTALMGVVTEWCEKHPDDQHAPWREALESITFTRTR